MEVKYPFYFVRMGSRHFLKSEIQNESIANTDDTENSEKSEFLHEV